MIYFDAAYIAKCYLNEPGAERVRAVAYEAQGLSSVEFARLEFTCIVQRHLREGSLSAREAREVFRDFERDEESGVWHWLPVTSDTIRTACDRVRRLPSSLLLRAGDALHLGCAKEHGLQEVYTNDRHMLLGAPHFDLTGVNILETNR